MTAGQIRHARDLLTRPDSTVSSIARMLGVSRAAICKYVPEVTAGRVPAALVVGMGSDEAGPESPPRYRRCPGPPPSMKRWRAAASSSPGGGLDWCLAANASLGRLSRRTYRSTGPSNGSRAARTGG
jgi:hypothetical protein